MAEAAADIGCGPHLPEQPVHRLGMRLVVVGQEGVEFPRQIEQDRTTFEDSGRLCRRVVDQSGDLGIGIDRDEAGEPE